MKNIRLRKQLIKHRRYLYKLYMSKPKPKCKPNETRDLLNKGGYLQIRSICRILHKTCNGEIPMKTETFNEIKSKHLLNTLRNGIERKTRFNEKLKDREEAVQFLNRIALIIPCLLKPLFVKEDNHY